MSSNREILPTFSFVPGRHHGPESWDYVRDNLERLGADSIAPNFDIENPEASLDDHAQTLVDAEIDHGSREYIRVGWSFGANVIPRGIGLTAVEGLVFISPAFHEATIKNHPRKRMLTKNHTMIYRVMQRYTNEERREMALFAFYHDADNPDETASRLREHPTRKDEPILEAFPDLPSMTVILSNDRATHRDDQRINARALGGVTKELESGHAPMFSKDKSSLLAEMLIEFAAKTA